MRLYPAIISKNTDNPPKNYVEDDFVKVRIPQFHGPKTDAAYELLPEGTQLNEENKVFVEESDLPWARLNRGLDNREFSTQDLDEDNIVYVVLENDNDRSPIIMGFAGRSDYTENIDEAKNNLLYGPSSSRGGVNGGSGFYYTFPGDNGWTKTLANKIVKQAKKEYEEFKKTGDSDKYNRAYGNPNGTAWCCAFIWYLYDKCGASKFFYGGNKTASCPTLWGFYDSAQKITTGFDVGDIVFYNGTQHVGLVIEKQANGSDTVHTIEGNTWDEQSPNGNAVGEHKKASLTDPSRKITGGVTFRKPTLSGDNQNQIFQYLVEPQFGLSFSKESACGIVANIIKESGCRPEAEGDGGSSWGICQWHDTSSGSGRGTNLRNFCKENKLDWKSLFGQLEYLKHELSGYTGMVSDLKNVKGSQTEKVKEAARIWCIQFERPANMEAVAEARADFAVSDVWPTYKNYKVTKK